MANKLTLDRDRIDACRDLAQAIVRPVQKYIQLHSTCAVERATLRLLGINDSKDTSQSERYPLANQVVDRIEKHKLALGVSFWMGLAKLAHPDLSLLDIAHKVKTGEIDLNTLSEDMDTQAFSKEDIEKFFLATVPQFDESLQLY